MRSLQILEKDLMSTLLSLVNCHTMTELKLKLRLSSRSTTVDKRFVKSPPVSFFAQILLQIERPIGRIPPLIVNLC